MAAYWETAATEIETMMERMMPLYMATCPGEGILVYRQVTPNHLSC